MKLRSAKFGILIAIPCAFVIAPAFGQIGPPTTYTWTGAADGTNFTTAGNWNPNGVPIGGDTAYWDGVAAGDLLLNYGGVFSGGGGTAGVYFELGPSQAGSVQVYFAGPDRSFSLGLFSIQDFSPAAPFILGDNSTNNLLVIMRPAGASHPLVNISTGTCVINPSVEFQAGGGNGFVYDFSGTGNWVVNNYLMPDNHTFSPMTVEVDGPGTLFWGAGATNHYVPNSTLGNFNIIGGAVVMTSAFPLNAGQMKNTAISNATSISYSPAPSIDPTLTNDTWNGPISGPGTLTIDGGTLTLGGASVYTGNTILSNGEAIVNAPDTVTNNPLGVGGTISFFGGTLGFSAGNSFDYSARFDTSANQAFSIDTAGQSVTFAYALNSSGGTLNKLGAGVLTLSGGSTYSGATTVSAGKLVFQGSKTGSGDITVDDGATLDVFAGGTPVTPDTLTVGTNSGATLEFDNVNSTTTPLIAAGTLSSAGVVTINVSSGTFIVGECYPLLTWTNGPAPAVSLGFVNGASGTLSTAGNVLCLNITPVAPRLNIAQNGNGLELSWAGSFKLQVQTNSLTGAWVDYPGGDVSPVTVTIDPANGSVFFRLVSMP